MKIILAALALVALYATSTLATEVDDAPVIKLNICWDSPWECPDSDYCREYPELCVLPQTISMTSTPKYSLSPQSINGEVLILP